MHWGQHRAFAHCGQCVITSVQWATEWVPGTQEAKPWYFFLLEPTIRYQVTEYLVNWYESYCWKPKLLWVLSLWSFPPTLLPPSNQCQQIVKTYQPQIKPFLHLVLEHWFIPSFFLPTSTFSSDRFTGKLIFWLCLLLAVWTCTDHLFSLSYSFHRRKMKEIVFASLRCYGNQIRYLYVKVL